MAVAKTIIFALALTFSFYGFRRVWRDIRDDDIVEDGGALMAIALWTVFYILNS